MTVIGTVWKFFRLEFGKIDEATSYNPIRKIQFFLPRQLLYHYELLKKLPLSQYCILRRSLLPPWDCQTYIVANTPKALFFLQFNFVKLFLLVESGTDEDIGRSSVNHLSSVFLPPGETWLNGKGVCACVCVRFPGWNWLRSPIWCRRSPARCRPVSAKFSLPP